MKKNVSLSVWFLLPYCSYHDWILFGNLLLAAGVVDDNTELCCYAEQYESDTGLGQVFS